MALSALGFRDLLFESDWIEAVSFLVTRCRDHRKFLVLITAWIPMSFICLMHEMKLISLFPYTCFYFRSILNENGDKDFCVEVEVFEAVCMHSLLLSLTLSRHKLKRYRVGLCTTVQNELFFVWCFVKAVALTTWLTCAVHMELLWKLICSEAYWTWLSVASA